MLFWVLVNCVAAVKSRSDLPALASRDAAADGLGETHWDAVRQACFLRGCASMIMVTLGQWLSLWHASHGVRRAPRVGRDRDSDCDLASWHWLQQRQLHRACRSGTAARDWLRPTAGPVQAQQNDAILASKKIRCYSASLESVTVRDCRTQIPLANRGWQASHNLQANEVDQGVP
jgi:hypothetical protein